MRVLTAAVRGLAALALGVVGVYLASKAWAEAA
jgi:hypothetical protein